MDIVPFLIELLLYTTGAFIIAAISTPFFVKILKKYRISKTIRESAVDGKAATIFRMLHLQKEGTPTMGGILVWGTVLIVVLLSRFLSFTGVISSSLLQRTEVYLPIFTLVFVGILGAVDDFFNVREKGKQKGLSFWLRSAILLFFGLLGGLWFYFKLNYTSLHIPFYGEAEIGWWYIPLFIFIIYMMSNAVNVTDGLDGLAGGLLIIAFTSLIAVSFARENYFLATFCGVIVGGLLAFLWNNIPPAKFYMGDTGAFALGATLGVITMMIDMVFILPFIGFLFFIEAGSVALQLLSKKLRGKKLFSIAPIHHHFEFIGWKESQIVMRFWIIGAFFAICGIIIGVVSVRQQQALQPKPQTIEISLHE